MNGEGVVGGCTVVDVTNNYRNYIMNTYELVNINEAKNIIIIIYSHTQTPTHEIIQI